MNDLGLPPPVVPADVYDDHYYRSMCGGAEEWSASGGAEAAGIYAGTLQLAKFQPGMVLLDVGTGRGEMLAVAVDLGAARAIGMEYASAATTLTPFGSRDRHRCARPGRHLVRIFEDPARPRGGH